MAYKLVDPVSMRFIIDHTYSHTHRTHFLGVVAMMKYLLVEEGNGSRCRPVMGSL